MQRTFRLLSAAAGVVIASWLAGAGPVAAHEGTPTTVPAASSSTPAAPLGEPTGTGILFGRAEYVPPPPPAAMATENAWLLAVMVAGTAVVAAGAALGAVAVPRRRLPASWPGRAQVAGAFALLFAGVAHVVLAPSHWAEGWHLGAFFAASGLLLAGQAGMLWLRPSRTAYRSVVVSTAALVVLYVAGRQFALPLVDHQDPYLLEDVPVKLAELAAAGLAVAALVKARETGPATARDRSPLSLTRKVQPT